MSTSNQPRRGRPPTGKALSAAERMRRLRARRKAAGLREVTTWTSEQQVAIAHAHFPPSFQREDEQRLYELIRFGDLSPERWRAGGPAFFMAGLAVLIAGAPEFPRQPLLDLAEALHPGILEINTYNTWLRCTPIEPSRFFSQLRGVA